MKILIFRKGKLKKAMVGKMLMKKNRMQKKIKKFKELDDIEKVLVLVLLYMMGRQCWVLIQILYTIIINMVG